MSNKKTSFRRHSQGFTTVPNIFITDKNLSDSAKCILLYLLHNKPDWVVYQYVMMNDMNMSKQKTQKAIKCLEKFGYLKRRQVREKGRFAHYEYEYDGTPCFAEIVHNSVHNPEIKPSPKTEKPAPVNQPLPMTNSTSLSEKDNEQKGSATAAPLPSMVSQKKKELQKRTLPLSRRYKLSTSQEEAFRILKEANLNTDDPSLCWIAKNHSIERITLALKETLSKKRSNAGGYLRSLLTKYANPAKENMVLNAIFAHDVQKMTGISLKITKTHVEHELDKFSLSLDSMIFARILSEKIGGLTLEQV